jgi:hypothetical protein
MIGPPQTAVITVKLSDEELLTLQHMSKLDVTRVSGSNFDQAPFAAERGLNLAAWSDL